MHNEIYAFAIFILNGFLIGLLFDVFRILRKSFKTADLITYIEDIVFWVLSGFILLYSIFKFNDGELRLYIFIGIFIGSIIYLITFSKIVINTCVYLIKILKKAIYIILIIPIKFLIKFSKRIFYKPTVIFCINISKIFKRILSNFKIKTKKEVKKV